MSIQSEEVNDFFNEDLTKKFDNKNNNQENNGENNNKEVDSTRSSLDLEKINYFAVLSDNENLKQNFLNDNFLTL